MLYMNGPSNCHLLFNFCKCTPLTIGHPTHPNKHLMESFHLENVEYAWTLLLIAT